MTNTFNNLTEEEKQAVASILKEYSDKGTSDKLNSLLYEDYDEIPVDINTFLHDKQYLGNALYNQEGKFTLYPYWETKLKDIFPTNTTTKYNTIIFTGAIGLGKTMIGSICVLYTLYRLLCLKDPYLFYGLQPIDKITISLINITLDNARGVALDKINQMILSSSWFMSHGEMRGITNLEYIPNKHIEIIPASSNNQVIGRAVFCLSGDTVIATDHGNHKLEDLVGSEFRALTISDNDVVGYSDICTAAPTVVTDEMYNIELEDGTVISCTPEHRFLLTDGSYKCAKDLTESDEIKSI